MTSTVALTPVMSEVEGLWTRIRIVVRGKEGDGVASAGKLFHIVPDNMNRVHIRFRAANDRIDSYNVQSSTEFTICEGVLHRIPDVMGSYELKVKSFQIYKFCTAPTLEKYV
jgi:hypothetical protein